MNSSVIAEGYMRLKWMSLFDLIFGVSFGLIMGLAPCYAFAAESAALLTHSLQDDYQSTVTAQQQSVMSFKKLKSETKKDYEIDWSLKMIEKVYENAMNKENLLILKAQVSVTYHMAPALSLNIIPAMAYFNGYTQTQNEVDGNNSVWTVKNATMDYRPWNGALLSVGALNQHENVLNQVLHTSMLMDDRSFPGVSAQLGTSGNLNFGFLGEAAIPSSASMTTQTGNEEATPTFQSAGLYLNYKGSRVSTKWMADYFAYNNLPSIIAEQSGLLGNSVNTPNGQANSTDNTFAYSYHGIETFGKVTGVLSNYWRLTGQALYIQNAGAPSGSNTAYATESYLDWIAAKDIMLSPGYFFYKAESDSVVASYNDSDLMPNMAGYAFKMAMKYKNVFKIALGGGERAPLVENPNQFHEHFFSLRLELLNVAI